MQTQTGLEIKIDQVEGTLFSMSFISSNQFTSIKLTKTDIEKLLVSLIEYKKSNPIWKEVI